MMRRLIARLLIRASASPSDRGPVLGDLDEARAQVELARGRAAGDWWLLRQAVLVSTYAVRDRTASAWSAFKSFRWEARDIRYALRALARTPAFTAVAISSLAVGIGATTAMFGLVYAVLLQPLSVPNPERLVALERVSASERDDWFTYREYASLKSAGAAIELAIDRGVDNVPFTIAGDREYLSTDFVGGNYFRTVGVRPLMGRLIDEADEQAGARVLVVSAPVWTRYFHEDPRAIGSTVDIKNTPFTLVGVTPASFRGLDYPGSFAAAVPVTAATAAGLPDYVRSIEPTLGVVGRLQPNAPAMVQAGLDAVFQRCCRQPAAEHLVFVAATYGIGGKDDMRSQLRGMLLALLGAVVLVLVIACLNVANLLLIRGTRRARELALRLSLGASRARVVAQLLTESVMLACAAGVAGLALAAGGRMLLTRSLPRNVDVMTEIVRFHVDTPVVLCTIAMSIAAVLLAGIVPALRATRVQIATVTKSGDRLTSDGRGFWLERAGVIVQVALAVLLVTTASLLAGTLSRLSAIDTGLRAQDVFVSAVETRGTSLEAAGIVPIHADMLARVRALPGVEHAAMATYVPFFGGRRATRGLELVGGAAGPLPGVVMDAITPDFFASTGIAIVRGRDFSAADAAGSEPVVVLTQSVAQRLGGGADLLGGHVRISGQASAIATVVGIARDAKLNSVRSAAPLLFYAPVTQTGTWPFLELTVRARLAPPDFDRRLRAAVNAVAPEARVRFPSTLETELRAALAPERFAAALASIFAVVALGLSAIGLYGLVAQQVARRSSELGVRVALGARGSDLAALVARQSLSLVAAGLVLGLPLALVAGSLIGPQLYGLRSWEPSILATSVVVMLFTAALALAVPARRAARTDPLTAMKGD